MLIRLVGHFRHNPKHIDKLISIKGLPEEWMFREGAEGKELIRPWAADVDKNIPIDIRQFCEPTYITFRHPPIERGAKEFIERKQILGIVLDYMTEPGRELWEKIERFMEGTIPRTEQVPQPVVCAKDEHSPFETYAPKRLSTGSLVFEPAQVPDVDLRPYIAAKQPVSVTIASTLPAKFVQQEEQKKVTEEKFSCEACDKVFTKPKALTMHKMKAHKKEKVEA